VGIFDILRLAVYVDAQFYDDIKDKSEIRLFLKNGECAEQGGKDKGQNSCSLRAGQNRGAFSVKVNLIFYTKTHDIAKSNQDGTGLATRARPQLKRGHPRSLGRRLATAALERCPAVVKSPQMAIISSQPAKYSWQRTMSFPTMAFMIRLVSKLLLI
jgi:hypothetical protein